MANEIFHHSDRILNIARESFENEYDLDHEEAFAAELSCILDAVMGLENFFPRIKGESISSWVDRAVLRLRQKEARGEELQDPLWSEELKVRTGPFPYPSDVPEHQLAVFDNNRWFLLNAGSMDQWELDGDSVKNRYGSNHWVLLPLRKPKRLKTKRLY